MQQTIRPWYKEPWPWILICIIVIPMFVAIVRVVILSQYKVEMVVDDYYKKGKAINQEFAREKLAQHFGISAFVTIENQVLVIDLNHNEKAPKLASLIISFYHSTQSIKDLTLMATARADGNFSAALPNEMKGKWQLTIEPHDKVWKIQQNILLPTENNEPILIKP